MDVGKLKQERDTARKETRNIALDNRQKITRLKEVFSKVAELKQARNKENDLANEFRRKREEKKNQIAECKEKLSQLREKMRAAGGGRNPIAIQEEVERLEWFQQTESLSPKEDKELSKKIKELLKQLPQAKDFQTTLAEYSSERKKLEKLFAEEKQLHEKTIEHSRKAQQSHEALLGEAKKADEIQKSISSAMELLKQKETAAGEKHEQLVKVVGERRLREMEERQRDEREHARRMQAQQKKILDKAREIYERFKGGAKISGDELMVLRESGLL